MSSEDAVEVFYVGGFDVFALRVSVYDAVDFIDYFSFFSYFDELAIVDAVSSENFW